MQRDSAEQHKNHISNLMTNEIDELENRKNQSISDNATEKNVRGFAAAKLLVHLLREKWQLDRRRTPVAHS